MLKRWIVYLTAWTGCVVFFICYRQWFAWVCLVAVTLLPLVSLILSLPAMLLAKLRLDFPQIVERGTEMTAAVSLRTYFPAPAWQAKLAVGRELTRQGWALKPGDAMPTDHCGRLDCRVVGGRVYDYLGLFSRRLKSPAAFSVLVRPTPVDPRQLPPVHPGRAIRWVAKRGGGYAENYELRLYRPGDPLQQIHWKLTGKTGKLLLREPMEPAQAPQLAVVLAGEPEALDEKLGILVQTGKTLTDQGVGFSVVALTGEGVLTCQARNEAELWSAVDTLLSQRPAEPGDTLPSGGNYHYIGGQAYEKT